MALWFNVGKLWVWIPWASWPELRKHLANLRIEVIKMKIRISAWNSIGTTAASWDKQFTFRSWVHGLTSTRYFFHPMDDIVTQSPCDRDWELNPKSHQGYVELQCQHWVSYKLAVKHGYSTLWGERTNVCHHWAQCQIEDAVGAPSCIAVNSCIAGR